MTVKQTPASALPPDTPQPVTETNAAESGQAPQRAPAQRAKTSSHSWMIAIAGVAALVVASLAFPRRPPASAADDGGGAARAEEPAAATSLPQPERSTPATVAPEALSVVASPVSVREPLKKIPALKSVRTRTSASAKSVAPVAASRVAETSVEEKAAIPPAAEPKAAGPATAASAETVGPAPVTITGCLEISVNHDEFRLTDTEGIDAPKSRSWRTGFLKKHAAPVAVVEPADPLALKGHVGQRVAATGQLRDRDLKVSSLRVVGRCN